ncbi:MAG: nucleoside-diphosphate kinase [Spirochaetaceae bacterium]|jgi:nucleoside-diphosphate kinase|nr:nucleoside-diphosphate kinase [Spirochaetaceae bacterium]
MTETTFIILKPDALRRGLTGQIISRLENAGLRIVAMKQIQADTSTAEEHYREHQGRKFYKPLVELLCSGPIILMALDGAHTVEIVRKLVGATEPLKAAPGTIRGDFTHISYDRAAERLGVISNLIHASDSHKSAEREMSLWFDKKDYCKDYLRCDDMYF